MNLKFAALAKGGRTIFTHKTATYAKDLIRMVTGEPMSSGKG